MKKSELSIILGLVLTLIISFFTGSNLQAQKIRDNTLRLHVIANDNSTISQNIKLQVKDTINSICAELYKDCTDLNQAIEITNDNLNYITDVTNNALKNLSVDYQAVCSIEKFYFDTTEYNNFTLPQGYYNALTIKLGKAEGKNWWCVVYPSLCRGVGAEYDDDSSNAFIETDNYKIKFKAVELWQDLKQLVNGKEIKKYDKI